MLSPDSPGKAAPCRHRVDPSGKGERWTRSPQKPPHLPPPDPHNPQDPPTNRQPQGSTHRPENLRIVQPIANPEDLPPDEQSPKPATRRGITETSSRPSNPPARPAGQTWPATFQRAAPGSFPANKPHPTPHPTLPSSTTTHEPNHPTLRPASWNIMTGFITA